jgi:hypothetical protein
MSNRIAKNINKREIVFYIRIILGLTLMTLLTSCATDLLSHAGSGVEVVHESPKGDCKNLGPVIGKGGGSFGGGWISDEQLVEYSYNALRNKTAEKGGTHVVVGGHQMGMTSGQYGGSTSTSTISGIAYKCKKN